MSVRKSILATARHHRREHVTQGWRTLSGRRCLCRACHLYRLHGLRSHLRESIAALFRNPENATLPPGKEVLLVEQRPCADSSAQALSVITSPEANT